MERYRVCVAEGCRETASALTEDLAQHDYDVVSVDSGDRAVEVCLQDGIDLLLLDSEIAGMSAKEVCARLEESTRASEIAVVLVDGTRKAVDGRAENADLAPAEAVPKPYNLPRIILRLDAAVRAKRAVSKKRSPGETIMDSAYTDHLTGLRNKRFLLERLQEEIDKSGRYDFPVTCVVLDVDDLAALDDELGAVSMDDMLAEFAIMLRSRTRTYDILARYDSTLFAVILPHSPLENAVRFAKKIINEVDSTTYSAPTFPTAARLHVGLVECNGNDSPEAEHVLGEAMRALLQAKSCGGQQIVGRLFDA